MAPAGTSRTRSVASCSPGGSDPGSTVSPATLLSSRQATGTQTPTTKRLSVARREDAEVERQRQPPRAALRPQAYHDAPAHAHILQCRLRAARQLQRDVVRLPAAVEHRHLDAKVPQRHARPTGTTGSRRAQTTPVSPRSGRGLLIRIGPSYSLRPSKGVAPSVASSTVLCNAPSPRRAPADPRGRRRCGGVFRGLVFGLFLAAVVSQESAPVAP